ncbi:hypothetical protein NLG97_g720 [Lecanicillium saksenae]|uniref:Uncharacterized protein n=1 Tax=Lecanicillium saksenae TaxID=468837 RepID=A0ACC1R5Q6_9HYPO|nr:hypothetical protein NLG97_g720 [Lecanicillium saksenae]
MMSLWLAPRQPRETPPVRGRPSMDRPIQKIMGFGTDGRRKSKIAYAGVTPGHNKSQKNVIALWSTRFNTYRSAILKQDINTVPNGEEIVRFLPGFSLNLMRNTMLNEGILTKGQVRATQFVTTTIEHEALWWKDITIKWYPTSHGRMFVATAVLQDTKEKRAQDAGIVHLTELQDQDDNRLYVAKLLLA